MRRISIHGETKVKPAPQEEPRLEFVRISNLVVDESYQRPLGKRGCARIRKIASEFDWSKFSPVLLADLGDGNYAIMDGQHRAHAAMLCGFKRVPAMIVTLDREDQARTFISVNANVTQVTTWQIYRAALAAGESWARICCDAVEAGGCQLQLSNSSTNAKKAGEIYAIRLIEEIAVKKGRPEVVTAVLRALRRYDKENRAALYSDYILNPLLRVVCENEAYVDEDLLLDMMRYKDPYVALNRVEMLHKTDEVYRKQPKIKLKRIAFATLLNALLKERSSAAKKEAEPVM